jgi:tetratricopeptide (TPR) repeat protein
VAPAAAADLGYVYTLSGRSADGLSLLERSVHEATTMGMRANQPIRLTYLGEALLSLGRVVEARARAEEALTLARELGEHGDAGWALRLLREIEALGGGPDAAVAEARYQGGLILAQPRGMRPLVAHCHLGLGKLYRLTDTREQAQKHLTTATTMYREIGMTYWLKKAEGETTDLGR